ncbi:MAG: hypothetical protein IKU73_03385 [Clostridia bacterium]|nr:hypothetical protein [Clostridia bacterium]
MQKGLLIGIDGGGTHSTAVAAWPDGRIAAIAHGGGLNFYNDGVDAVRRRLDDMVQELCRKADAPLYRVCVGMSALDGPADEKTHTQFTSDVIESDQLDLQSDAYIALMGFTHGAPGMIVICGTGSMLLMCDETGRQLVSGGWGYLLGDTGSGYTLAREGLLAAIDASEGLSSPIPLEALACQYFGVPALRQIIDCIYAPDFTPDRMAGFARHVLEEAARGEETASAILARNMNRLARQVVCLLEKAPAAKCIGLYGGIFAHSEKARAFFADTLRSLAPQAEICSLEYPPEIGAIIHLMQKDGTLTDEVLYHLKHSYEDMRK